MPRTISLHGMREKQKRRNAVLDSAAQLDQKQLLLVKL